MTNRISLRSAILAASAIIGVLAMTGVVVFLLTSRPEPAPVISIQGAMIGEPVAIELAAEEAATVTHESGARIYVPVGATSESTTVSVTEVKPPISFVPVGRVFDFSVGGVELAQPVTIHIPFELGPGDDASQVQALHWNEAQAEWEPVDGSVDSSTMTVAVTMSELSWFTAIANKLQPAWDSLFGQESSPTVKHTCWAEPRRIPTKNPYEGVSGGQQGYVVAEVTNISRENNIFVRFEISNPHVDLYEKQETGSLAIPIGTSRTFRVPISAGFADGDYMATCTVVSEGLPGLHLDLASHTIPFAIVGHGNLDSPPDKRSARLTKCFPGEIGQEEPRFMHDSIRDVRMHAAADLTGFGDLHEEFLAWYYIYKDGDTLASVSEGWEVLEGGLAQAYSKLRPGQDDPTNILEPDLTKAMGIRLQDPGKYAYKCTLYSKNTTTKDPIVALAEIPKCNTRERFADALCVSATVYEAIPDWHFQSMRTGQFCIRDCTPGIDTSLRVNGKVIGTNTGQSIEIGEGETVTLSFELGGLDKRAELGGITVSFPSLTQSGSETDSYKSTVADVSTASSAREASEVTYYDQGDVIWRYRGDTIEANYLMVENYGTDLQVGAERTLDLAFTPHVAGDYQLLYRTWLCGEDYQGCLREPTASGDPAGRHTYDQQEWETYSFTIKVGEPAADPTPIPPPPPVVAPPAPVGSDREALIALYNATDGPNWQNLDGESWLTEDPRSPLEDWHGVTVHPDYADRAWLLTLRWNCLRGELPSNIGNLTVLESLFLAQNKAPDADNPSACGSLEGPIPASLAGLTNLRSLYLSDNNLSGAIPSELGNPQSALEELYLANNRLSGAIPTSLGNLRDLYVLDLRGNRLRGQIPDTLANLPNLEELKLSGGLNRFTGCIPAALFDVEYHDLDQLNLEPCGDDEQAAEATGNESSSVSASEVSFPFQDFHLIQTALDEYGNHDAYCKSTLGTQYRLADWNDLTSWVSGGGSIPELIAGLRLRKEGAEASIYSHDGAEIDGGHPRVSFNGEERWSGGRGHFFISRHDHARPSNFLAHEHIDDHHISLGSSYGQGGTVLCYDAPDPGTGTAPIVTQSAPGTPISFARNSAEDFTGLASAGNAHPEGIWSDGATMWVSDPTASRIYAYDMASKERVEGEDFDGLRVVGNRDPQAIWSDGAIMWVADTIAGKIYAYDMASKERVEGEDFDGLRASGNRVARGLWSDGTTMWVSDELDDKLYAYDLRSKERDASRDFNTLKFAGNQDPEGMWSDGFTMWVADLRDSKIYAYDVSTKESVPEKELILGADVNVPGGIWSNGTTMWAVTAVQGSTTIQAYNMPAGSAVVAAPVSVQTAIATMPSELSANELLSSVGEKLSAISTAKFRLVDETESGAPFFGTTFKWMDVEVEAPDRSRMLVEVESPGFGLTQVEVVAVGDEWYIRFSKNSPWGILSLVEFPFSFAGLATTLGDLFAKIDEPAISGRESVNGTQTIRVDGSVASEELSALFTSANSGHALSLTLWVDEADHNLRQMRIAGQIFDRDAPGTQRLLTIVGIDVPVDIQAPDIESGP